MKGFRSRAIAFALFAHLAGCYDASPDVVRSIEQGLCKSNPEDPCCPGSPIVLDLEGDGFHLTDLAGGVRFGLNPAGGRQQISWTAPGSNEAWLALDRNGNGVIDDGSELFGNFTPQPTSESPQGYLALAQLDTNGDFEVSAEDAAYADLLLWQDRNHNGVSEAGELSTLPEHGILGVDVAFTGIRATDQYGNLFRYGANVRRAPGSRVGPYSYDVFLINHALNEQAHRQGALQPNGAVSMATVVPVAFCGGSGGGGGGGGGGDIGITDPSIFFQYGTVGGVLCRAVCWAAGSAVCAAVAVSCAVGATVTIGGLVVPCTAAIIAACAASGGASSICSDLICP